MKKYLLPLLLVAAGNAAFSQCKTFMISVHGDTLNCTDKAGLKQGKWVVQMPELRGEPGYEQEGVFENSKKTGTWRTYSLQGDLQAIENYKYGFKNGTSQYFTMAGMIREESWKAVNPDNPYDTVDVYDLNDPNKITQRVMKAEGTSYRQGTWTYYDPTTGAAVKTENYVFDKLQSPFTHNIKANTDSTSVDSTATAKKVAKPAAVLDYEKKNSKKKIKVRDGSTGY